MQGPSETYGVIQGHIETSKKGKDMILAFIQNKYIWGNAGSQWDLCDDPGWHCDMQKRVGYHLGFYL